MPGKSFFLLMPFLLQTALSGAPLIIVREGKSDYQIVIRDQAPEVVSYAAAELKRAIKLSAGADLAVVKEPSKTKKSIFIGYHKSLQNFKEMEAFAKGKYESYHIENQNGNIIIYGTECLRDPVKQFPCSFDFGNFGVLYGVYDFIEKFLGTRWYEPGEIGEAIEKNNLVTIDELPIAYTAHAFSRAIWPGIFPGFSIEEGNIWALRNKIGGSRSFNPNHSMDTLGYVWMKENAPDEIFGLNPGGERRRGETKSVTGEGPTLRVTWNHPCQYCFSSEKLVSMYLYEVDQWYKGSGKARGTFSSGPAPDNEYVYLVPPDNQSLNTCYCSKCQTVINSGKYGLSELIWNFKIKVARALQKSHPDKKLAVLAYETAGYLYPPPGLQTLPENMVVRVCYNPYQPFIGYAPYRKIHYELTEKWSALATEISVWHYISCMLTPYPADAPRQISKYYSNFQTKIRSAFLNPWYQVSTRGTEISDYDQMMLNVYFSARSLWNPNYDINRELKHFYKIYYGPAEKSMSVYHEWVSERWENLEKYLGGEIKPATLIPDDLIYLKVYPYAELEPILRLITEAENLAGSDSVYQKRILKMRQGYFDKFVKNSLAFSAASEKIVAILPAAESPIIDGRIYDPVWKEQERQFFSKTSGPVPAEFQTWFKAAVSKDTLYLLIRGEDPHYKSQMLQYTKHDSDIYKDDSVEIFLMPDRTKPKNIYQIIINLNDVVCDLDRFKDGLKWESGVKSKTLRRDGYFSMEAAIPLKNIGIKEFKTGNFIKFNICRNKKSGPPEQYELSQWAPTGGNNHNHERYGNMTVASKSKIVTFERPDEPNIYFRRYLETADSSGKIIHSQRDDQEGYSWTASNSTLKINAEYPKKDKRNDALIISLGGIQGINISGCTHIELKFRLDMPPGSAVTMPYKFIDEKGVADWDYVSIPVSTKDWQVKAINITRDGRRASAAKDGVKFGRPVSAVSFEIFLAGTAFSTPQKGSIEVEYIKFTDRPVKDLVAESAVSDDAAKMK